jgi:chemotaxis protein MotB
MSSKHFVVCVGVALLGAMGCAGMMTREEHDREMTQANELADALRAENASLKSKADAYDQLNAEKNLMENASRTYAQMAESLRKALDGLGIQEHEVYVAKDTGAFVFATDLLFDSGSYALTPRGKEALKRFAELHRGERLKIVGHTDNRRIARPATVKSLPLTDTNLELSADRALVVMRELMNAGIPERAMYIEGKGATEPRAGGDAKCRRVEIFVLGSSDLPPYPAKASMKSSKK